MVVITNIYEYIGTEDSLFPLLLWLDTPGSPRRDRACAHPKHDPYIYINPEPYNLDGARKPASLTRVGRVLDRILRRNLAQAGVQRVRPLEGEDLGGLRFSSSA